MQTALKDKPEQCSSVWQISHADDSAVIVPAEDLTEQTTTSDRLTKISAQQFLVPPMNKEQIVEVLETIATLLELQEENPFKIRAYTNAARSIETTSLAVATRVATRVAPRSFAITAAAATITPTGTTAAIASSFASTTTTAAGTTTAVATTTTAVAGTTGTSRAGRST